MFYGLRRPGGRPGKSFRYGRDIPASAQERRLYRLIAVLAFVFVVAMLTPFRTATKQPVHEDISQQGYAKDDITADYYFETVDLAATEEARAAAAARVSPTYRVDREAVRDQLDLVRQRISAFSANRDALSTQIREALLASTSADRKEDVVVSTVRAFAEKLKGDPAYEQYPDAPLLAQWLMPDPASLPEREFEPLPDGADPQTAPPRKTVALTGPAPGDFRFANHDEMSEVALAALEYVLSYGVMRTGTADPNSESGVQVLRERTIGDQKVSEELPANRIPTPESARATLLNQIQAQMASLAESQPERPANWEQWQNAMYEMVRPAVVATLRHDEVVTEGDREKARESVKPVMKSFEPDQIIIRRGSLWTEQARSDVLTYWAKLEREQVRATSRIWTTVSNMILAGLALACLVYSAPLIGSRDRNYLSELNVSLLLMCGGLAIGRVVWYFGLSGLAVPVSAIGILLAILTNARFAMLTSALTAVMVSIQFGYEWNVFTVAASMSVAGIYSLYVVRRRSDLGRAAVYATVIGVVVLSAIVLATDSFANELARQRILLVLLNGGITLFIVPGLLSPLERLFGITTDMQLLEYSDLNNELLSRLALEIPATYSHSLMLGQLAEAACDAIGANGLKARVCAYYHDIGKMRRPEYFSENQTGVNIHDDLSPRLSARAIASHVIDGVEMARQYRLPKPIIDGILEHHGTTLISFFYQEALKQQKHGDVREEDFRYPGPKPQSRETAVLMICDGVESGVRSIKNPNEERVREFVDKIITSRANDGQFDECDLNLRELSVIGDTIATRLAASLHSRVSYPESVRGGPSGNIIPIARGQGDR